MNNQPDINEIEIFLNTNITGQPEPILLTKDLFYKIPNIKNKYPYFVFNYALPKNKIFKLSYEERVQLFFDKAYLTKIILKYNKFFNHENAKPYINLENNKLKEIDKLNKKIDKENKEINKQKYLFINNNIKILLQSLFPIAFPIVGNYLDSYNEYILQNNYSKITTQNSLPTFLNFLFPSKISNSLKTEYSYLQINNVKYTISKVIYLNDFINNPKYFAIIDKYLTYTKWKTGYIEKIKILINEQMEQFIIFLFSKLSKITFEVFKNILKKYLVICKTYYSKSDNNPNYLIYNTLIELIQNIIKLFLTDIDKDKTIIKDIEDIIKIDSNIEFTELNDTINKIINNQSIKEVFESQIINKKEFNILITNINKEQKKLTHNKSSNKLIKDFDINLKETYDYIIPIVNDIYTQYTNIKVQTKTNIYIDFIETIISGQTFIKKIHVLENIKNIYLEPEENTFSDINFSEKNENNTLNDAKEYMNTNAIEYVNFINYLKTFTPPNRVTSNLIIANNFVNFIKGDVMNLNNFLDNVNLIIYGKNTENKDQLFTGIDYYMDENGKPKFEIQIYMDFIQGEINDTNVNQIQCAYTDDTLVNLWDQMKMYDKNRYIIPTHRSIFLADKILNANEKGSLEKNKDTKIGGLVVKKKRQTLKHNKNTKNKTFKNTKNKTFTPLHI
jgi:hypothetical protein